MVKAGPLRHCRFKVEVVAVPHFSLLVSLEAFTKGERGCSDMEGVLCVLLSIFNITFLACLRSPLNSCAGFIWTMNTSLTVGNQFPLFSNQNNIFAF